MDNLNNSDNDSGNKTIDPRCWNLNFPIYPPPYYPLPPRTPYNTSLDPAINNWTYFWTKDRPKGYWMHVRQIIAGTKSFAVFGCVLQRDGTTLYVGENFLDIDNFIIAYFSYY